MSGQPIGIPNPSTSDEIEEGRSWWKVCCIGCCLGVLVIIVLLVGGIRFFMGPGPKVVSDIPVSFPSQLTLFRPELKPNEILYFSGSSKSQIARVATGPLNWFNGMANKSGANFGGTSASGSVQSLQQLLSSRLLSLEGFDTVALRWNNLDATPEEITRFYAGSLKQAGIFDPQMRVNGGITELLGSNDRLKFSMLMVDTPEVPGVDSLSLVVEYPSPKSP
jgi:hypothetical protein